MGGNYLIAERVYKDWAAVIKSKDVGRQILQPKND